MKIINCKTQEELDNALAEYKDEDIRLIGDGSFSIDGSSQVRAYGSSQVTAYGSSQVTAYGSSQVTAYGSSQVTACDSSQVTACDSSQVRACDSSQVRAYGSSQVTACDSSQVTACDSSQVTACDSSQVTACDSSQVRAYGSSQVRAAKYVAVTQASKQAKVKDGVLIKLPTITKAKDWCDFYGVVVQRGVAILYKALNEDFTSPHGTSYAPNTTPTATDWDGGKEECGGGLHFSPRPFMALKFHNEAKKFVACPVLLKEIVVHKNASYPDKVKAPRVYKPCYEVDIEGNLV